MFKKILIANRGEIAVRIIRACQELSIKTVAVYSTFDKDSLHTHLADEAREIGPPSPLESYLNIEAILKAALSSGADAIHPGYGFLAENPAFAKKCLESGLVFIGPNPETLELTGNKIKARQIVKKQGIPVIPGTTEGYADLKVLSAEADRIGYPLIIKAAGGGGGKGMRIVNKGEELKASLEASQREAYKAFGDSTVYLEKYLDKCRHIEFQILADKYGNAVHLFERECSIQRRYQKLLEETPSTALTVELRAQMGETAVRIAKFAGYDNVGTVEFLLNQDNEFYFLEINARIQVEHPVTELTTRIDIVKEQISLAAGQKLSFKQTDICQLGHAIECRIYAEDPGNDFLPSPGKILFLKEPNLPGIRNDTGIFPGYEVSLWYDPILSKLISWGTDRNTAIRRMKLALLDYVVLGPQTTIGFLSKLIDHPEFIKGNTYTNFIEKNMSFQLKTIEENLGIALISAGIYSLQKGSKGPFKTQEQSLSSPWLTMGGWSIS